MHLTVLLMTIALLLTAASLFAAPADDLYKLSPDSLPQDGTPRGQVNGPFVLESKTVYPGTVRNYWIYVPQQYTPEKPACLMIFQDGHAYLSDGEYRIPDVFDNLIYRQEVPVTICVFINPGHTPEQPEPTNSQWGDQTTNRRVEYNALDDKYSKLIIDELMPEIEKKYKINPDPDAHAISGASSGAIAAFTVAWHHPDVFRKVISTIGSFTNIMGGHQYPDMILKADKKPIRVFMQDTLRDIPSDDPQKDWHKQNILMVKAFSEKGYDMNYSWGIGTHSQKMGACIMPAMQRWLWRDFPKDQTLPAPSQEDTRRRPATTRAG